MPPRPRRRRPRFATAGSVDDGKSTLVGRLLHDAKAILADQLAAVTATSAERGFVGGEFDFALLTDGLRAEREQGITIDVAYRYFATDRRSFILADCPGHVQYTRNMVTGATTADAVVVLIDARNGATEQTRRHLTVVHRLGIRHVIVAINKIDLLDYDEAAFAEVAREVGAITEEIGLEAPHLIPVSALAGDNVAAASANTPWYQGPSCSNSSRPCRASRRTRPTSSPSASTSSPCSARRADSPRTRSRGLPRLPGRDRADHVGTGPRRRRDRRPPGRDAHE